MCIFLCFVFFVKLLNVCEIFHVNCSLHLIFLADCDCVDHTIYLSDQHPPL